MDKEDEDICIVEVMIASVKSQARYIYTRYYYGTVAFSHLSLSDFAWHRYAQRQREVQLLSIIRSGAEE